ncbi:hypothetical protein Ahy_A09g044389 [Arachis hypogaea]|uniref:Sec-independent protein translocase protein TatA n=1 Tax=Arachis hypogaea TaxID=3818 RepID=A0A445BJZ5_ARAHY|nr:hypothetical protein Ahy_A09g044389 [Arachis hypogaea]
MVSGITTSTRRATTCYIKPLTCNALFGLGVPELVVIASVTALVFGPKNLPQFGRNLGKTLKSFQQVKVCDNVNNVSEVDIIVVLTR